MALTGQRLLTSSARSATYRHGTNDGESDSPSGPNEGDDRPSDDAEADPLNP